MIKDPCFPCSWGIIIICIHYIKLKVVFVDNIDENNNLNIYETVASTNELVKIFVNCYWYFESIKSMQKTSIE